MKSDLIEIYFWFEKSKIVIFIKNFVNQKSKKVKVKLKVKKYLNLDKIYLN